MMLRLQRQEDRLKRRNFKYTSIPEERRFRHYHLKVGEYDDPQKGEHTNFKVQNIPKHGQFHHLHQDEYEMIPVKRKVKIERQTTERQIGILAGIIGIIIWALSPFVSPLVISVVKNGKHLNINIKYLMI